MIRRNAKRLLNKLGRNGYETLNHIEINRQCLLNNFLIYKKVTNEQTVIPVLKGNAYGHGLAQVAKILNEVDCEFLAVDGYFEAAALRDISEHRILVMGYIKPSNVKLLDLKRCSFVVQDIDSLKAFGRLRKKVHIHIELNTGMNRMGLQPNEVEPYLEELKLHRNLQLEGVMSHLADADNPDVSFTSTQTKLFDELVEKILEAGFKPKYIHLAQSAGSAKVISRNANAVRIGIGLYGINPLPSNDENFSKLEHLQPILEFKSTIVKVTELNKGDKVSYNGTFIAPATMKIGVLPVGYYEGLPRELSNSGTLLKVNGEPIKIVGRVCMNHTMIDLENYDLRVGDEVLVFSRDKNAPNSIQSLAENHRLFSYSLLSSFSSSVRRIIV